MRSIPSPSIVTKRESTRNSTGQLRDCCLRSSHDFPQSPEHCSPTKYARVSRCSHGNVVMLFCPSFTQSERFLQTDQLIIRLQVVVKTNFINMLMRNVFVNVFKSDAVIWWAAIFRRGGSARGSAGLVAREPPGGHREAATGRHQGAPPGSRGRGLLGGPPGGRRAAWPPSRRAGGPPDSGP